MTLRPITSREMEVLHLIAQEHTIAEIAEILYISHHTVNSHRKNLMTKLNAKNIAGLIRRAYEARILKLPPDADILPEDDPRIE